MDKSHSNGFTKNSDLYRESKAHSEVPDLEMAMESLPSLAHLSGLDIATGSGHTAFFFAEKHVHMFGIDLNEQMLSVAQEESDRQTLGVRLLKCPAEDLMFDDATFDLVTCRLAAHHFAELSPWLQECRRVMKPNGHLLIIDNVVLEDQAAAAWMNAYEIKRDSSHGVCLTPSAWTQLLEHEKFQVVKSSPFPKTLDFSAWMERMSKSAEEQAQMWDELVGAPKAVLDYWKPRVEDKVQLLTLHRQVMIAKLEA